MKLEDELLNTRETTLESIKMVDFSDYMIKLKRRVENYFTSKKIDLTPFDFLFSDKKTVYEKPVIIDEIESSKYFNKERSSTDYVK